MQYTSSLLKSGRCFDLLNDYSSFCTHAEVQTYTHAYLLNHPNTQRAGTSKIQRRSRHVRTSSKQWTLSSSHSQHQHTNDKRCNPARFANCLASTMYTNLAHVTPSVTQTTYFIAFLHTDNLQFNHNSYFSMIYNPSLTDIKLKFVKKRIKIFQQIRSHIHVC